MDYQSVELLIGLIAEGIGVTGELKDLGKRILDGEIISQEEIQHKRAMIRTAFEEEGETSSGNTS